MNIYFLSCWYEKTLLVFFEKGGGGRREGFMLKFWQPKGCILRSTHSTCSTVHVQHTTANVSGLSFLCELCLSLVEKLQDGMWFSNKILGMFRKVPNAINLSTNLKP